MRRRKRARPSALTHPAILKSPGTLYNQPMGQIVLTTPYILGGYAKADWVAYLKKQLLGAIDQRTALRELLKYGTQPNHWNEFVFQAYHHHQPEVIFLAGLPDVQGSLPHSSPLNRDED